MKTLEEAKKELLTNDNVNVWTLFEVKEFDKCPIEDNLKNIVKTATAEELKVLIAKFDEHEKFDFMEDFIVSGEADNMGESEYWAFIEEAGL